MKGATYASRIFWPYENKFMLLEISGMIREIHRQPNNDALVKVLERTIHDKINYGVSMEELYEGLLELKSKDLNNKEEQLWSVVSTSIIGKFHNINFEDLRNTLNRLEKESDKNKDDGLTIMEYKMIEESVDHMLKYYEKIPIFVISQLKAPLGSIEGKEGDLEMEILKEAQARINKFKENKYCDQCHKEVDVNDQTTYGEFTKICNCPVYKMKYTKVYYPSYL
jgi:hypothetical protein